MFNMELKPTTTTTTNFTNAQLDMVLDIASGISHKIVQFRYNITSKYLSKLLKEVHDSLPYLNDGNRNYLRDNGMCLHTGKYLW